MSSFLRKIKTTAASLIFPTSPTIKEFEVMEPREIEKVLPKKPYSPYPFIIPLFNYRNEKVQEIVWHIKYRGNSFLIDSFGKLLFERMKKISKSNDLKNNEIHVTPIPLSRKRLAERKYNQSELLATSMLKNNKENIFIYSPDFLKRTINTLPQTKLKRKERLKNMKNCFVVPEKEKRRLKDKTIILIDDVTTTGSTLKEARLVLLQAGAKEVYALTLAH
ncbi:MAG: ComF family protein [Candidatus Paceibacterota bacterium]